MTNNEKPEVLQKLRQFEERLQALGIAPDKVGEASALLTQYNDLQSDLAHYRQTQFYDDAAEILFKTSGRGPNKTQQIALFLREFAEHIAGCVIGRDGGWVPKDDDGVTVVDLVDQIPVLYTDEGKTHE